GGQGEGGGEGLDDRLQGRYHGPHRGSSRAIAQREKLCKSLGGTPLLFTGGQATACVFACSRTRATVKIENRAGSIIPLAVCKDSFIRGSRRLSLVSLRSVEAQVSDHSLSGPVGVAAPAFHRPGQGRAQGFPEDRPTGFADGRQLPERPFI